MGENYFVFGSDGKEKIWRKPGTVLNKENLQPSITEDYNFYQDNDPKHKSHLIQQWLIYNVSHVIVTPVQSPDLNLIEHLWEELDRKIRKKSISNQGELKTVLKTEWEQINSEITMNLVQLMLRRLQAVIQAKGYPTKY
ncbi:Transposable element Tcb1 transposase [Anthophora plagiata]